MFMDDVNNRYTYLNSLKNIVWEEPADRAPRDRNIQVHDELVPIIDKLIKERPTWRFKSTQQFYMGGPIYRATDFAIYDGDEALGRLWLEHHWRDSASRFFFNNARLERARMKRQTNFSTKPDIAAKRILKAFHLKTPKERAAEAFTDVRGAVQKVVSDNNWPLRRAKNLIEQRLFSYAAKHWDEIKSHLTDDVLLDFPALMQLDAEAQAVSAALGNSDGVAVRIEANGSYLVARTSDGSYEVQTLTDATLPDHLRGALGLLKLVGNGDHIPDVGIRANPKLYFVMDKKGESDAE